MPTEAPNTLDITIVPFGPADIPTVAEYQQTMAKETEGKELCVELVVGALERLEEDRSYGQCYLAKLKDTKEPAGSVIIGYVFDALAQRLSVWYQSVYVDKRFRKRGIFSRLFKEVEDLAIQLKADTLCLYVEKENLSAQAIYEKLGMHKSNKVFVEKDFHFSHEAAVIESSRLYDFEFNTISRESKAALEVNELFDRISDENTQGIVFHTKSEQFCWSEQSLCVKVHSKGSLVGLFTGFVEISDWRNGLNVYINNYTAKVKGAEFTRLINELEASITGEEPLGMPTTVIRFVVDHDDERKTELEIAGYHEEHYYVYEKEVSKPNN